MKTELSFFTERSKKLDSEVKELERQTSKFSIFRLIVFLIAVGFIIAAFASKLYIPFIIPAVLFIAGFIVLCVFHSKTNAKLKYKRTLFAVNNEYIARINGDFSVLKDKGTEFSVKNHDYAVDLDIFGESSVYALYNISESAFGRREFANELLNAHTSGRSVSDIKKRQKTVKEIGNDISFLQDYQVTARLGKMFKQPDALLKLSETEGKDYPKSLRIVYRVLPYIWLVPIVLYFLHIKYYIIALVFTVILNLTVSFALRNRFAEYFKAVDGISKQTQALYDLYVKLEDSDIKDEYFRELISCGEDKKVSEKLSGLSRACNKCKFRDQPIVALVLNVICLYDLFCADKLISWASKDGKVLPSAVDSLAKIECMMSASVVEIISSHSCLPEFVDCSDDSSENAFFEGKMITHPLLKQDKAVSNSVLLDHNIALITGSNMSGKTTLIRTIGTLSVLAYIGAFVPADYLKLGRMRIVSSMRIVDDMKEEMSTFKAELVRISRIVEAGKTNMPMMFLIDEIFRGTNSADRTEGAMTVLNILSLPTVIGLMTTHDYALCDECQATKDNIAYYYFSETYDDYGINFDYKLKSGVSQISNAKYLMKLVGIE